MNNIQTFKIIISKIKDKRGISIEHKESIWGQARNYTFICGVYGTYGIRLFSRKGFIGTSSGEIKLGDYLDRNKSWAKIT
jgi:hypothetical protein